MTPPGSANIRLLLAIMDLGGGSGEFCRMIARGLGRYFPGEFAVELLVWRDRAMSPADSRLFHAVHVLGCPIHEGLRRGVDVVAGAVRLRRELEKIRPDVALTVGTYANLLLPAAAGRLPVVLSEHVPLAPRLEAGRGRRGMAALMRWRYRRHSLVCPSRAVADELRQRLRLREVTVIPHGVDVERAAALAGEAPVGLPAGRRYAVACGTLTAAKDYPTLLRAFASACKQGLALDLAIVGDGPERASRACAVSWRRFGRTWR